MIGSPAEYEWCLREEEGGGKLSQMLAIYPTDETMDAKAGTASTAIFSLPHDASISSLKSCENEDRHSNKNIKPRKRTVLISSGGSIYAGKEGKNVQTFLLKM